MIVKTSGNNIYTKKDDLIHEGTDIQKLNLSPFLGAWTNTKENSGQLPQVELRESDNKLYLKVYGADLNGLIDWGESECEVFTENPHDGTSIAFITGFNFDQIDVDITANVKLGVLVIQTYTKFNDGSGRLNYYTREFYGPSQS
ncbi:MAG: hypothetical protein P1U56_08845 [Saprospiraceae bacterium]|nr:hypothetical protein [Saprospiraceae bacterium]